MSTEAAVSGHVHGRDTYGDIYPLTVAIEQQRSKDAKTRMCLHCNRPFNSEGPGNRFCGWCRTHLHLNDDEDEFQNRLRCEKQGRVDTFQCFLDTREVLTADGEEVGYTDDDTVNEFRPHLRLQAM